jgi:hypothetical protein
VSIFLPDWVGRKIDAGVEAKAACRFLDASAAIHQKRLGHGMAAAIKKRPRVPVAFSEMR